MNELKLNKDIFDINTDLCKKLSLFLTKKLKQIYISSEIKH